MRKAVATLCTLALAGVLLAGGTLAALPGESAGQKLAAGRQVWASASGLARQVWSLVRFMAGLESEGERAAPAKQAAPAKKPGGAAKARAQATSGGQSAPPASQPKEQGSAEKLGAGAGNVNARDGKARALEEAVFRELNRVRRERGLPELRFNDQISEMARLKSIEMLETGFVTHDSPAYGLAGKMYEAAGLPASRSGEVTCADLRSIDPDKQGVSSVEEWLSSRPHRRIILGPLFTEVGVGVAWVPDPVPFRDYLGTEGKMRVVVNALFYTPMANPPKKPPENAVHVEVPSLKEILEEQGIK